MEIGSFQQVHTHAMKNNRDHIGELHIISGNRTFDNSKDFDQIMECDGRLEDCFSCLGLKGPVTTKQDKSGSFDVQTMTINICAE